MGDVRAMSIRRTDCSCGMERPFLYNRAWYWRHYDQHRAAFPDLDQRSDDDLRMLAERSPA